MNMPHHINNDYFDVINFKEEVKLLIISNNALNYTNNTFITLKMLSFLFNN